MEDKGRDRGKRKGTDPKRVPVELLLLGCCGFVLLLIGAALSSDTGDTLANVGLLLTLGSAIWFLMRWIIASIARR
jgi:hypothetical protein